MNPDSEQQIKRLWELQKVSREQVQAIADHMGRLASAGTAGLVISQDRWDQLFASWEAANKRMQDIGEALSKAHGI